MEVVHLTQRGEKQMWWKEVHTYLVGTLHEQDGEKGERHKAAVLWNVARFTEWERVVNGFWVASWDLGNMPLQLGNAVDSDQGL